VVGIANVQYELDKQPRLGLRNGSIWMGEQRQPEVQRPWWWAGPTQVECQITDQMVTSTRAADARARRRSSFYGHV